MIATFRGEHRFLSNFWPAHVAFDDVVYPSTEHAYQAAKTLDVVERVGILTLDAGQAKKRGKSLTMRPEWDRIKLGVMRLLIAQKFSWLLHPTLATQLVETSPHELIETNSWHDIWWGRCDCERHVGSGENHLGRLLMERRDELIASRETTARS